ncbi:MAG: hypothetical protein U1D06_10645, partial [Paracoccaceae bacterium]|nr:hypothetical protein [Paracoccaceae bacterium]
MTTTLQTSLLVTADTKGAQAALVATAGEMRKVSGAAGDLGAKAGKAIPYSDEVRDRVLALPYARIALARTYFAAVG